jgi:predicted Fe-Mo cluster-binding NifX family protein
MEANGLTRKIDVYGIQAIPLVISAFHRWSLWTNPNLRKEYDAMKIAVSSSGPTLDDSVEARFGRCAYFLVIDPDTLEFEPIQNPNIALGGGAGIQSAQLLANKDVTVVLTGNCGPNAFQTFGAAGIQVITGVTGQVREAVRMYKSGEMAGASGPNVQSHFGMGMGGGMGGARRSKCSANPSSIGSFCRSDRQKGGNRRTERKSRDPEETDGADHGPGKGTGGRRGMKASAVISMKE